ncbi:hypothetical protein HBP99_03635 [Listeria booriae]|uniref:Uncharacterized protein n=1 Tax=Listeria booriae TaxID=1552123 RepID=A0A7X1D408_9LIST|nr:hypothetical protein [Listeria booriae]MBC1225861.1 hypothetical protein [Listeria booriae]MBC1315412.1 hypothetical protein [Listeria booriae]MBC2165216.1 hypothetical protein [Listeria booriae]MBC2367709.1 hypothetical protein [Listeria booriae]
MKKMVIWAILIVVVFSIGIFCIQQKNYFVGEQDVFRLENQLYMPFENIGREDKPKKEEIEKKLGTINHVWDYWPLLRDFDSRTLKEGSIVYKAGGFPKNNSENQTYYTRLIVETPDHELHWYTIIVPLID